MIGGLIRHEIAATLRAHGHHCAAAVALTATDATTWALISRDCDALGSHRSGTYAPRVMRVVVDAMATGNEGAALSALCEACGMTAPEWVADTTREMALRSVAA